jgi:hypothetical protein
MPLGCTVSAVVTAPVERTTVVKHIPAERLAAVAKDEKQEFSPDEFRHLRNCPLCLTTFCQLVHQGLNDQTAKR